MCLILDTNCYGDYVRGSEDMQPVMAWVEKGGRLAYSDTDKHEQEFKRHNKIAVLFTEYDRAGKTKFIPKEEVLRKQKEVSLDKEFKSDDQHIIALALAGNIKLLVSHDEDLISDFKKRGKGRVNGKVYKKKQHRELLRNTTCK